LILNLFSTSDPIPTVRFARPYFGIFVSLILAALLGFFLATQTAHAYPHTEKVFVDYSPTQGVFGSLENSFLQKQVFEIEKTDLLNCFFSPDFWAGNGSRLEKLEHRKKRSQGRSACFLK